MQFNLADLFESLVDSLPADRIALVSGNTRLTYRELDARANRLAHALQARGIGKGDHIGLYLYNGNEFIEAMLAAFKLRAVPININYRYVTNELRYMVDNADLKLMLHQDELAPAVVEALGENKTVPRISVGPERRDSVSESYEEILASASPERGFPERSNDDLHVIYTGGTTGMPRGVMWRHEDLLFSALQGGNPGGEHIKRPEELAEVAAQEGRAMTMLPAAPLIHGQSQLAVWIGTLTGGKVVLVPGRSFRARQVLEAIAKERVDTMTIVGDAMARPLADTLAEPGAAFDTSSLMVISSSGAILSESVKADLEKHLPSTMVLNNFGASETGHQGTVVKVDDAPGQRPGFFMDETTTVLGDDLKPVEPGAGVIGKLARRGKVPLGYYKDPVKTAATFLSVDGVRYVIPGDLATIESDGRITVFGRGAVCINTGGEKVFPEEVEEALKGHAAVLDAVVVGTPDPRFGERVEAIVQIRPGQSPSAADLDAFARTKVAGYKTPRAFHFVGEVVRHPSGKPDYRWAKDVALKARAGSV
jgi:acyl-CoA synthetase (AMP-forming)/AMP-acid ligase II